MRKIASVFFVLCLGFSISCCSIFDRSSSIASESNSSFFVSSSSFKSSEPESYSSIYSCNSSSYISFSSTTSSSCSPAINPQSYPSKVLLNENEAQLIFTGENMWTQGMCAFQDGFYLTQCSSSQGNYHVSMISDNGETILNSSNTFNHANGLSCDQESQRLFICKFAAQSGTDGCDRDCDFSFYIVNASTFEIEQEIDLYDIVKSICPESIGIGGIAFNNKTKKLCVLTRKPQRFVIFLNDDFSYDSSFFICDDGGEVLFGDICSIDDYIVTCYWDWNFSNVVSFYDMLGNNVKNIELSGITHIESVDFLNGKLLANFNDFSNEIDTRVYAVEPIT